MSPETIRELRRTLGYSRAKFGRVVVNAFQSLEQQVLDPEDAWWYSPFVEDPDERVRGVSPVTVYRWEKGLRSPRGAHLEGLLYLAREITAEEIRQRVRREIREKAGVPEPQVPTQEPLTGNMIRQIRGSLGASQADAALMVGVQRNTWARWERGERTPHPTIQRVIRALRKPEPKLADPYPSVPPPWALNSPSRPGDDGELPEWVVPQFRDLAAS